MFQTFQPLMIHFEEEIRRFGGIKTRGDEETKEYVFRENVPRGNRKDDTNKGSYFGCIPEGETPAGPYHDLSIVVFPSNENADSDDKWIIALVVGSLGFKNDYEIASMPGTKRNFLNQIRADKSYIKNSFIDIESHDGFKSFIDSHVIPLSLKLSFDRYKKLVLACTIFDPNDQETAKDIISKYLAIYASKRGWDSNASQRKAISSILSARRYKTELEIETEVKELLKTRKYIVLQGAPGTGKTRLAKRIVNNQDKVFFTQFHAETSYSDFIYSIVPKVDNNELGYTSKKGVFVDAIEYAQNHPNDNVYLIIDEINRANLSNVLGPAFYLFEPTMSDGDIEIEICPGLSLKKLPEKLFVIATMNTADRSLAVLDFALRRRFAWYTLYPQVLDNFKEDDKVFCKEDFSEIAYIFENYANDEELSLQPGHAYFIVSKNDQCNEIDRRLRYEIMPLIKEYLADGMLTRAKDSFINHFRKRLNEEMFK